MRKITDVALSKTIELHKKWLDGDACGRRANLAGANLADANLTCANLARANLTGADLADANLAGANLYGADLTGANLTDANLADADLADADLTGANLTDANLADANLTGANLYGADLTGANLTGANLADADLADANLACANLARANLSDANLYGADLARANLARANLTGADLTCANLADANGMVKIMGVEPGNIYWKRFGHGMNNNGYQFYVGINTLRSNEVFASDDRVLCSYPGFHFASRSWCAVNYYSRPLEARMRIPEDAQINEPWATDGKASADKIEILQVFDVATGDDVTYRYVRPETSNGESI